MEFLKTVIHDPWVCGTAWVREWVRRGARSTGRDNDPDGLGYMPDSQGPQYGSKPTLTGAGVSGPRISPSDVFSPWHKSRERNYQCPLGALIIPLPHVFPPTYVGFGISYILGNLIKAKISDHDDQTHPSTPLSAITYNIWNQPFISSTKYIIHCDIVIGRKHPKPFTDLGNSIRQ